MEYEEFLEQGEILAGEGLIEEALARFEQALAAAPENPEVIEAVGRALLNLDRLEEAEASFLDALELDPEWVGPRMGLAMVALRRDEPFKIVHHLERAIETDPEYPDAYVELGRYYGTMAEPALAKATFERWTSRHPEDADMLINAGLTAFDAYEEVIAETPEWWEAHANLGICHARNGQPARAEAAFRRGLEDCPGSPEIRDELAAHLLAERRDLHEALRLSEEAVALGRDEIRHLHTLGEARLVIGDEAGAAEAYRAMLALDPENPEAHLELGLLHEAHGEVREAEEHFVESLKSDPANPRALYSYASLYYAADDLETAEELLVRAVASDAHYSPALSALASVRARRGDYRDALDYIEKAVEAGESDVEHFKSALEFAPLRADPRFRSLLSRMVRMGDEG